MISERHGQGPVGDHIAIVMKKFITLSQVFERHWNSSFSETELEAVDKFRTAFNLKEFSSGGACIASIFACPVLLRLDENGRVSFSSVIHPELPPNKNLGILLDKRGTIDNPRNEFLETFKRFKPLIDLHGRDAIPYFMNLKKTSGELSQFVSKVLLESQKYADPDSLYERKAISDLIFMQKGIYTSLGIENPLLEELEREILESGSEIYLGNIGVGNSGTFFFCVPDIDSMHSFKNLVDKLNLKKTEMEKLEIVLHGSSHRYIFNIDPLMVIKK